MNHQGGNIEQAVIDKAKELGASLAGITSIKDLKASPSYAAYDKKPFYEEYDGIKWKPEHLNTVDFMVIPNINYEDDYGRKVLDLYVGVNNQQLGIYTKQFFSFMIVDEEAYSRIQELVDERQNEKYDKMMDNEEFNEENEFEGAVIAECNFDDDSIVDKYGGPWWTIRPCWIVRG